MKSLKWIIAASLVLAVSIEADESEVRQFGHGDGRITFVVEGGFEMAPLLHAAAEKTCPNGYTEIDFGEANMKVAGGGDRGIQLTVICAIRAYRPL